MKGPLLFAFGYFVLEMLGVPAFPLTMSAGALFGAYEGTLIVVSSATVAAVVAFLISRYVARDAMKKLARPKSSGTSTGKSTRQLGITDLGWCLCYA